MAHYAGLVFKTEFQAIIVTPVRDRKVQIMSSRTVIASLRVILDVSEFFQSFLLQRQGLISQTQRLVSLARFQMEIFAAEAIVFHRIVIGVTEELILPVPNFIKAL